MPGLLLVLGIKTRLTAVIAFIVLSLSFFYFQESVYSHVTLFGTFRLSLFTVMVVRKLLPYKKNESISFFLAVYFIYGRVY